MKKFLHVVLGLAVIFAIFITTVMASVGSGRAVSLTDNGVTIGAYTSALTVSEFLAEMDIALNPRDTISPVPSAAITEGTHIEINRAFPVYIRVDGGAELTTFYARPGSFLSMLVNDYRAAVGMDFAFDSANWHRSLTPHDIVELGTVTRAERLAFRTIAHGRDFVESEELMFGEEVVIQPGRNGLRRLTSMVEYISGVESASDVISDEIYRAPVNEVVLVGTALPPNMAMSAGGEVFRYLRELMMEATAYTRYFHCTGRHPGDPFFGITASGMTAQVGVVAVDTNVIPFHTRLYIEGYGFAIAGDRGSAIRGNKIDLFFETRAEALQFGRQHLRVWILDEA